MHTIVLLTAKGHFMGSDPDRYPSIRLAASDAIGRGSSPFASLVCAFFVAGWAASAGAQITTLSDEDPAPAGSLRAEVEASANNAILDVQIGAPSDTEALIRLRETLVFDNSVTIDNSNTDFGPVGIQAPTAGTFIDIETGVAVTASRFESERKCGQ